jgi:hypothetical protein
MLEGGKKGGLGLGIKIKSTTIILIKKLIIAFSFQLLRERK